MNRPILIHLGALGDFILTLPLARALAARGTPPVFVARRAYSCLVPPCIEGHDFFDVESPAIGGLLAPGGPIPDSLAAALTQGEIHAFLRDDPGLRALWRRLGCPRTVFHDPRPARPPHIVRRFFEAAGLPVPPDLLSRPGETRPAGSGSALWLHPGTGSRAKNVPPEVFLDIARRWRAARGATAPVIASFGEADEDRVEPFRRLVAEAGIAVQMLICPPLRDLRDRMAADAAFYAGGDTGVSHLAAALGVPSLVFFLTTDPDVWRPAGPCTVVRGRPGVPPDLHFPPG